MDTVTPDSPPAAPAPEATPPAAKQPLAWLTPLRASLLIALASALVCGLSLPRYGITSDSPSLFYSGQRHLFWMTHPGVEKALALMDVHYNPQGFQADFERFPDILDPAHYPVFPGFVAAVSAQVFHKQLGWLDKIDGYHLGLVLLQGALVLLFGLYACRLLGRAAGIAATFACAFFPTVIGHAANNAKDLPCAMFYGIALMATGVGVLEEKRKHLFAAAVAVGFGLSAKLNAAFVFPTLIVWSVVAWVALYRKQRAIPRQVIVGYVAAPFIAFLVFFLAWPWLWYGGPRDWFAHLAEYVRFMASFGSSQRNAFTAYSLKVLLFMTPPLVLVAALWYAATGFRGGRRELVRWALLLCWVGLPLLRIALPKSNFYDSNRHFMEYAPGLCAMAGLGAVSLGKRLWELLTRFGAGLQRGGLAAAGVAGCAAVLVPVATYHPYQTTYFNFLVGGLGGAQQKGLFRIGPPQDIRVNGTEGDYWFSSARDAFRDLRRLNPGNEPIGICGPGRSHAMFNLQGNESFRFVEVQERGFDQAPFLYTSPRESLCGWRQVRRWERERPVLLRVERGGGLIYEILGPKDGQQRTPPSPETDYERFTDPRDRDGLEWKKDPNSRAGMARE